MRESCKMELIYFKCVLCLLSINAASSQGVALNSGNVLATISKTHEISGKIADFYGKLGYRNQGYKSINSHLVDKLSSSLLSTSEELTFNFPQIEGNSTDMIASCWRDIEPVIAPILDFFTEKRSKYRDYALTKTILAIAREIEPMIPDCSEVIDRKLLKDETPAKQFPTWAWDFLDAMAKPPTGIMGGNLQWVGSYEMCNKIDKTYTINHNDTHNETRSIRGKYCRLMIGFKNSTDELIQLGFGACLPDTCSTKAAIQYIKESNDSVVNSVLGWLGLQVKDVFCGHDNDFPNDTRAQFAIAVICILIVVALGASIYDGLFRNMWILSWLNVEELFEPKAPQMMSNGIERQPSAVSANLNLTRQSSIASNLALLPSLQLDNDHILHEKPSVAMRFEAAFAGFSVLTSFRKVCDISHLGKHHFPVVDTIRFLSLAYAIGGNTFLFGIIYTESITTSNLVAKMLELPHYFIFQPIVNFAFTADSFLVISGFMVSYHWLRRLEKAGGNLTAKQIIYFYVHKYFRLMPMMMLTIMLYSCLYKYLVSGPLIPNQITDAENCKVNWWANLLMIGNLVNTNALCLGWTWYAPMLFQLQIISPLILVPYSLRKWAGWLVLIVFYVIYIAAVSGVVNNVVYPGDTQVFDKWYFEYILTPWCRAGPYFIGLALGILLFNRDSLVEKIPKNLFTKTIAFIVWILAVLTVAGLTFGTYSKNQKENPVKWTRDQEVTHDTLSRSAWGLAIAWMILACETGFGGIVKTILSYGCFTPVSRLSYPVFVIHAIFIFRYAYSQYKTLYITFIDMLYVYFGHIILIYMLGFILGLIFYFPFGGLERALTAKTKLDIVLAASHPQQLEVFRLMEEGARKEEQKEESDKHSVAL